MLSTNRITTAMVIALVGIAIVANFHSQSAAQMESIASTKAIASTETSASEPYIEARRQRLQRAWSDFEEQLAAKQPPLLVGVNTGAVTPWPQTLPSRLDGTHITLQFSGTPLAALVELNKQPGAKIITSPEPLLEHGRWPTVNLDVRDRPLMDVIMQLCSQCGLVIIEPPGANPAPMEAPAPIMLGRSPQGRAVGQWTVCGPFVFTLQRMEAVADLNADPLAPSRLLLTFTVSHEPAIHVVTQQVQLSVEEAIDELEHSLIPEQAAKPPQFPIPHQVIVELAIPENAGSKIKRLRAHYVAAIQSSGALAEGGKFDGTVDLPVNFDDLPLP